MSDQDVTTSDTFETRIARLELAIFGNKDLRISGIQDKLDKLEQHAQQQEKHNERQRWVVVGIVAGLAANGLTLATVMRLASAVLSGTVP